MDSKTTGIVRARPGVLHVLPATTLGGQAAQATMVKHTKDGTVQAIQVNVPFDPAAGHTYELKGKRYISAVGYAHANKAMGISFWKPERVVGEDGQEHCNPHVTRDEFGTVNQIKIRCVGIGRNAAGNRMMIDSTLYYDLDPILAQDVLNKWKPRNGPVKNWGTVYPATAVPANVRESQKCIALPGGYVLAVKLEAEMLEVIAEHANRVRFATRNAETIVQRNLLAQFLGRRELDKSMSVAVVAWSEPDVPTVERIKTLVEAAERGDFTFEQVVDTVDDPAIEAAVLSGESEEETKEEGGEPDPGQDLMADIALAAQSIPERDALAILSKHGFQFLVDVEECSDGAVLVALLDDLKESTQ